MLANRHERGESAIGAAGDAHSLRVTVAGVQGELDCGHIVLKIASTEILIIGVLEFDSVSGRATRVRSDHYVAARSKGSDAAVECVLCLSGRATVGIHDHRRGRVALQIERKVKEGADGLSIKTLVVNELRCRNVLRIQAGDSAVGK